MRYVVTLFLHLIVVLVRLAGGFPIRIKLRDFHGRAVFKNDPQ